MTLYNDTGKHGYLPPSVRLEFECYEHKIARLEKRVKELEAILAEQALQALSDTTQELEKAK